jgi:DNA-binding NtrC family response regulator
VITDLIMPDLDGIELLKQIKQRHPQTDVVIMSGFATIETAVEAMRFGAYDYFSKPLLPGALNKIIEKLVSKKKLLRDVVPGELAIEYESDEKIIGQSQAMKEVFHLIKKVAPTDSTVLITGESGTGKDLIAKAIHYNSLRRDKPFMAVDCGSLVETLFESELFGHVKGSFTGAIAQKHGSFELANGGTFFFDEIGNISLNIQAKILRAIQEKEIKPVGDVKSIKVDVRVIAATNLDLRQSVQNGKFREDLFYRLSVIPIHLPELKERRDDIIPLAEYFLQKFNQRRKRDIRGLNESVRERFLGYDWPGNVRELENVIERAVIFEEGALISLSSLPSHLRKITASETKYSFEESQIPSLAEIEKQHIAHTLEATGGNRAKTARILGIDRKTLYDKIRKYNLSPAN